MRHETRVNAEGVPMIVQDVRYDSSLDAFEVKLFTGQCVFIETNQARPDWYNPEIAWWDDDVDFQCIELFMAYNIESYLSVK